MQKAGRSFLNCRYEPATGEKTLVTLNNNYDYKNSARMSDSNLQKADEKLIETNSASVGQNMARSSPTVPENAQKYFKLTPWYWYAIILPALGFTFVSLHIIKLHWTTFLDCLVSP